MSTLKKNISANLAGNFWKAIIGLAFIPLYIRFMGVESYGLIGIFTALQAILVILDMGLSATLTRELARLSVLAGREQEMRDMVRSLEIIYWSIAVFIMITIMAISPFVANRWIKAETLSPKTIEQALRIMGFAMALEWPAAFYAGGLMGLQRQVLFNAINISISTVRCAGAVLTLWLISPTIQAFFSWQIVISFLNVGLLTFFLWQSLPRSEKKPSFQKRLLIGVWRFAAGMSGLSILGTILAQLDKVILSKMLPLEVFAYYTIATAVTTSLYYFIVPIFSAIFPKFTQLVSMADHNGLKKLYHDGCQFMSVLILPVAVIIAMFSYEILLIWTQDPIVAGQTYLLVSILIIGTALHGLVHIPYALQLAHGWVKLALFVNSISVIVLVPLIIYMTNRFGVIGGASGWLILNVCYILISIPLVHKRLLPHENYRWYMEDVLPPLAVSFITAGVGRLLIGSHMSQFLALLAIGIVSITTLLATAFSTPVTRAWLFDMLEEINLA